MVAAESEPIARDHATRAFVFTSRAPLADWIRFNPWTKPELVACTEITETGNVPPAGVVVRSK